MELKKVCIRRFLSRASYVQHNKLQLSLTKVPAAELWTAALQGSTCKRPACAQHFDQHAWYGGRLEGSCSSVAGL